MVFFITDDKKRLHVLYETISVFKTLLINTMHSSANSYFFLSIFALNIKAMNPNPPTFVQITVHDLTGTLQYTRLFVRVHTCRNSPVQKAVYVRHTPFFTRTR